MGGFGTAERVLRPILQMVVGHGWIWFRSLALGGGTTLCERLSLPWPTFKIPRKNMRIFSKDRNHDLGADPAGSESPRPDLCVGGRGRRKTDFL